MNVSVKEEKSGAGTITLTVKGDMTIYTVGELKNTMIHGLEDTATELEINLAQVGRMDTAGFQLFLLLEREANAANKKIVLKEPSGEVKRLFGLYKQAY